MRPVVVTGMGLITSLGNDRDTVRQALQNGRHGFSNIDLVPGCDVPIRIGAPVPDYHFPCMDSVDWKLPASSQVDLRRSPGLPPHGVYAQDAVSQALTQAGLTEGDISNTRTGLFTASSGSPAAFRHHLNAQAATDWQRAHPLGIVRSIAGTLTFNLVARFHIEGAGCGFSSACASSSHALGYAHDEIALGRQDRMIVVGAEECLAETVLPFDGMRALCTGTDPDSACRPFDRDRSGFVVTGGAVAMVLECEETSQRTPLARMLGWGQASDGYHVASPHPEGAGLARAMDLALHTAKVDASQIDYVNAHATSTPAGDRAEALALRTVFPPGKCRPPVISTKGLTGHGLALAGIMEAAFIVLSLENSFLPGNRNLDTPDEACEGLHLPTCSQKRDVTFAMNNSSGFGGANVSHIFQACA